MKNRIGKIYNYIDFLESNFTNNNLVQMINAIEYFKYQFPDSNIDDFETLLTSYQEFKEGVN